MATSRVSVLGYGLVSKESFQNHRLQAWDPI